MVSAIVQKVRQTPLGPVNSRVFEVSEATFAPDSGVEFLKIWEAANGNRRAVVRVVVSVPPSDTLSAFLGDQPEPVLMPVRAGVEEGPDGVRVGKVDAQTDVLSDHVGDGAKKGLWSGVKALF
ncbi:hypothetical protein CKO28_13325 [Rhodovibrio sodomensis]|uniref:Uncharacterized protein n=2 Tax=Rhodovibrio sodomensis TaxID=1088 RepID=A0ABS1DFJ3_9PROT|nr:hypothetical protein [Rhodovibrio sodomensis]